MLVIPRNEESGLGANTFISRSSLLSEWERVLVPGGVAARLARERRLLRQAFLIRKPREEKSLL